MNMPKSRLLVLIIGLICPILLSAQSQSLTSTSNQPQDLAQNWADSLWNEMDWNQRLGQLFMVAAYPEDKEGHVSFISGLIEKYGIGGLIFMKGDPVVQVKHFNEYQRKSKIPLLISQDAEWGLQMRLKGTTRYPRNMTLGAIQNDSLIYNLGAQMAEELHRVGVHVNFAPVVDVNNNPNNPVINDRSFGENKYNVARKGIMIAKGLQDHGIMACAKHFPGHGDTDMDSHLSLPVIPHDINRLDSIELYPFNKMNDAGVQSMMIAHLYIPSLDNTKNQASTLSPRIVSGILRDSMGFDGLIFTDALNMKGVTKFYQPGQVDVNALRAGNDVLLFSQNVPKAISMIKKALKAKKLSKTEIEKSVKRILKAKYHANLDSIPRLKESNVLSDLISPESKILKKNLYEAALTMVKNDKALLPLNHLEDRQIAYIQINGKKGNSFERTLKKYGEVHKFQLPKGFSESTVKQLMNRLKQFNTVIVGVFDMSRYASKNFGVSPHTVSLMKMLQEEGKETVLTLFGSPYSLKYFGSEQAILMAYEPDVYMQQAAASAIFGGLKVNGKLPVTASEKFPEGLGLEIPYVTRFGFSLPEEEGMDSEVLVKIDSMLEYYIDQKAMPGCAVLALKGNNIVYAKGFGRTEYEGKGYKISPYYTIYDLASLTKVSATTVAAMHLVEQGQISLNKKISDYLTEFKGSDKANITVRQLLQHNSGLPPGAFFYLDTYEDEEHTQLDPDLYSNHSSREYSMKVAPNLYAIPGIRDSVWKRILNTKVRRSKSVRYSDLGMVIMANIIERVTGESLEDYARKVYYDPLGMNKTYFNPAEKGLGKYCPPTELDTVWRKSMIRGYVHDPTAAILGGCTGNAGLFSNVYDLCKLLFMLKNKGVYGNYAFLEEKTVSDFTKKQLKTNRRGLGWDKPETDDRKSQPASDFSSPQSFGHLGFTGTAVWVDPKEDLIYILLSNRTYPYSSNRKFVREEVRSRVLDVLYESIHHFKEQL